MTATITPTEAAVQRGAAVLDDLLPGWAERIDVLALDLAYTDRCVLGQLFAADDPRGDGMGYEPGLTAVSGLPDDRDLAQRRTWAAAHGFDMPPLDEDDDTDWAERAHGYVELTGLWAAEIRRRTR